MRRFVIVAITGRLNLAEDEVQCDRVEFRIEGETMEPIQTINVIKCADAMNFSVEFMRSHQNTEEGRMAAEADFKGVIEGLSSDPVMDDDMETYLDEGRFDHGDGFVAIVHSC